MNAFPPSITWRTLLALIVLVMAVHGLVLQAMPSFLGFSAEVAPRHAGTFQTRRIEVPPLAPVRAQELQQKRLATKAEPMQSATETIASAASTHPASDAPASAIPAVQAAAPPQAATSEPAGIALQGASTPVTAMALPASVRLAYKASGFAKGLTYHADGELRWTHAGGSYDARMTISALFIGSRSLSSQGSVSAEGLAPSRFADKGRTEVAAHFDAEHGRVTFSANTPSVPWVKGMQDRVSVFMQLGGMLAGKPDGFAPGSLISMYTVGPRDADTWTFRVDAEEAVALPFGEMRAIKLTRQPRREFDQQVEIWYAPALGYLPVRSKITQYGGDFVDQQLSAVGKI